VYLKLKKTTRVVSLCICSKEYIAYLATGADWTGHGDRPNISGSSQILRTSPSSSGGPDGRYRRCREAGTLPALAAPVVFDVVAAVAAAYFADFVFAAYFCVTIVCVAGFTNCCAVCCIVGVT
jgi:hypothetical protein